MQKPKRKRRDGLLRQAQIMDVALKLFAENGYHRTSIDDIIKSTNIVKGTFYLHFESKYHLLEKIIDSNLQLMYESVKLLDISMPKPIEEIKKFYIDTARMLMQDEKLRLFIKVFFRDALSLEQSLIHKINNFFQQIADMSTQYISKAQREGRVKKHLDAQVISYSIIGAVKEILYHIIVFEKNLNIDTTITTMLDTFLSGMLENA
ncbi:MAG: TetR/AcrR family transcriptional regulator [Spirochaetes bacterium]|nr:TetR/AcrR family transcriptional regulator [Spirochaetota bacterium]